MGQNEAMPLFNKATEFVREINQKLTFTQIHSLMNQH
jgi:hypothetical protein